MGKKRKGPARVRFSKDGRVLSNPKRERRTRYSAGVNAGRLTDERI